MRQSSFDINQNQQENDSTIEVDSSDGRYFQQNRTKVTSTSPIGANDKNNNNYITKKMMIAQDDFNSADQRRLTLNTRSGPNPMLNLEEE